MADNEWEHIGTPHPNAVEQRLGAVETRIGELGRDVGALREEVGGLRGEVGGLRGEVGELRGEVQKLRVLAEDNQTQIKQVLEQHGAKFDAIEQRLKPLEPLPAQVDQMNQLLQLVVKNHEQRITTLEKHTGLTQ
jgi:predicted nuclease with TOPRIM domain